MNFQYIIPVERSKDYLDVAFRKAREKSNKKLEGEDNEDTKRVMENWMKHFKIKFHKAHCSGHASQSDIKKIVAAINPKLLIPVHTENAKGFKEFHSNVKVVKNGDSLEI